MNQHTRLEIDNGSLEENVKAYCKLLSLPVVSSCYQRLALEATKAKMGYQEYLYAVLQQQVIARVDNSINARIKKANFPWSRTLEEFDYSFQPQLTRSSSESSEASASCPQRTTSCSSVRRGLARPTSPSPSG